MLDSTTCFFQETNHDLRQKCNSSEQSQQRGQQELMQQAETERDDWQHDEQFNRLRRMTEILIEQAQNALLFQPQAASNSRMIMTSHHHYHHRRSSSTRRHRSAHNNTNSTQQQQQRE